MILQRRWQRTAAVLVLLLLTSSAALPAALPGPLTVEGAQNEKPRRPKLTLRSNPAFAFSPALVTLTVELKGGDDDFEPFYCAAVEWDWDDGTRSEKRDDCPPYEPGTSEIRRRYAIQHRFNIPGVYNVRFRLKQRGEVVASVTRRVTVRRGR